MFLEPEPTSSVIDRIRRSLQANGINAYDTGTVARQLVDVFMEERGNILSDVRDISATSFLGTASHGYLDAIGRDFFNKDRLGNTYSSVTELDGSLLVYVNSGTLSDFLPSDSVGFYIPEGIDVIDSSGLIVYSTDKRIYVENASTRAFISASAVASGPQSNVPAGALIRFDIEGIESTNVSPVVNGSEIESDDNYRSRLSNAYVAFQGSNLDAIREAALEVPGVADVVIRARINGPGTVQVLVLPEGNTTSQSVLSEVERAVFSVKSEESVIFVDAPAYVSISADYSFTGRSITQVEADTITSNIQDEFRSYVAGLQFNETIDPSSIILNSLSNIVGIIGKVEKLCVDGIPISSKLYKLKEDQLGVLDITKLEPIRVFI